jgi:cytochrome P450 family 135
MTASTGGDRDTHTASERPQSSLDPGPLSSVDTLPRAGIRELARDHGRFFRPDRQRSPLWSLGDRFLIDVHLGPKVVLTSSPQDAKAVFADRDGALSFGEMLRRFTPHEALFGGDSYIFREGEAHLTERRKIAPPLHGKVLKSYERAMVDIVLRRLPEYPLGKPVRFSTIGGQLALDVMMTVIFGVSKPERMRRLERAMLDYCGVAESPSFLGVGVLSTALRGRWLSIPRLARTAAAVDAIVLEEIAERRRTGSRSDDCLTIYLELNEREDEPYDDAFLARSMRGLMLAGFAATTVTIGWFADLLVHHPGALASLEQSLDRGEEDYLEAVIAETLRLRPALPFTGRRTLAPFNLDGLLVPPGAFIIIAIMALHERADLYPDPLAFRPERFLSSRAQPYTWVPFGGGVHYCLGAEFTLFEARVLLRTLLEHRRLRAVAGRRGGRSALTHPLPVPAGGAPVVLTARD